MFSHNGSSIQNISHLTVSDPLWFGYSSYSSDYSTLKLLAHLQKWVECKVLLCMNRKLTKRRSCFCTHMHMLDLSRVPFVSCKVGLVFCRELQIGYEECFISTVVSEFPWQTPITNHLYLSFIFTITFIRVFSVFLTCLNRFLHLQDAALCLSLTPTNWSRASSLWVEVPPVRRARYLTALEEDSQPRGRLWRYKVGLSSILPLFPCAVRNVLFLQWYLNSHDRHP